MDNMDLVWQPEEGEPRCCKMFDNVMFSNEWAVLHKPSQYGKEVVAAAVDRIMSNFGVMTVLDDLLASLAGTDPNIDYLRGCSGLLNAKLAAAT